MRATGRSWIGQLSAAARLRYEPIWCVGKPSPPRRIFTPRSKLPFAGHPMLGTAHALLEAARIQPANVKLVHECGAGLVEPSVTPVEDAPPVIAFTPPAPRLTPLTEEMVDELESILDAAISRHYLPQRVDVGAVWTIVEMTSA